MSYNDKKYKNFGKKFTIEHVISEGESNTTIYDIINRSESGKLSNPQQRGGRQAKNFN